MSLDNKVVDLADLKVSHDYLLGRDELLSDRINELGSGIDGIQSQITALGNGSPIPVETVAEMTDNTKAYLYTGSEQGYTSGYWYTYDSTQAKFVPRGEYGAGVIIDSTLTVTGNAADAKATGDAIKAGKTFVVQVPGSAAVLSGSITAGDFAKALAAYTAGSGVYAVKDGEVYQLSAVSSSTMTFTQMYHGTMNFIKQIQITSADTFTVTNTALSSSATDTSYSNTASGLTATNVQAAIDENAAAISNTNGRLDQQQTNIDAIAKSETTVTGNYIEVTDPDADSVVKTLNTAETTDLKLVVCKGNILCLPYFRPNNYSTKGLTFTINSDYSITVNGTATADVTYTVAYYTSGPLLTRIRNGNVQYGGFLSGCTDGSDSTYYIVNVNTGQKSITGPVDIFGNASNRTCNVAIVVKSGVTLSNKTFYPMISLTGTEEYTPPTTPLTATVESTDGEYTWDGITFNDGYNLIAGNMGNEISLSTGGYLSIKSVKDDVERVEEKVDALYANWWKGKKWVAFGTSITDNWSQNSYITQGEHTGEHTGKYVPYLLAMSELSESAFVNRGIAGGSINGHILYYLRYYANVMTNADLITIEGAVNDFATSIPLGNVGDTVPYTNSLLTDSAADGTFAGACYQAFVTAQSNAPNAVVVLLTETTGKNHEGYANYYQLRKNSLGLYQSDYIEMTMKVAEFVGIPVINCGRDSMINAQNPQYIADHIHHTFLGGYQYATAIWNKLKEIPLKQMELPS